MNERDRGYLNDPYRTEFSSAVSEVVPLEGGRSGVYLEETFFYPESGGQPADRGMLGGREVVDVREDEKGVLHVIEGVLEAGERVEGRIDGRRRFDHMQQHSGQHLLSRVFLQELGLATIGFHLGEETCTIDLGGESVGAEEIEKIELKVNEHIWRNIPVSDKTMGREAYEKEAGDGVRSRLPDDAKSVRIVEIEGVDRSTCCGTHVRSTGEIGLVKILRVERVKGGPRIEFVCGGRALRDYAGKNAALCSLAGRFSTDWRELERVADKLVEESKSQRKTIGALERELARFRATELAEPTGSVGVYSIVKRLFESADAGGLRETVSEIRERERTIVLFGMQAPKPALLFACSKDVPLDMGELLKRAAPIIGARGGGGRDFAQGGGGDGGLVADALDEAERMVKEILE